MREAVGHPKPRSASRYRDHVEDDGKFGKKNITNNNCKLNNFL